MSIYIGLCCTHYVVVVKTAKVTEQQHLW